jgi:hypothetical protein
MSNRHELHLGGVVLAAVVLGCGDSQPKTALQNTEPKEVLRQDEGREIAKTSKGKAAKAKPPAVKPKPPEPPWLVTLPSGATLDAFLRPEGENRLFLGRAGRFSGIYELRGNRLVLTKAVDPLEAGFEWEARSPDEYALVTQPPNLGSNYLGAILKRVKNGEAKKPSTP